MLSDRIEDRSGDRLRSARDISSPKAEVAVQSSDVPLSAHLLVMLRHHLLCLLPTLRLGKGLVALDRSVLLVLLIVIVILVVVLLFPIAVCCREPHRLAGLSLGVPVEILNEVAGVVHRHLRLSLVSRSSLVPGRHCIVVLLVELLLEPESEEKVLVDLFVRALCLTAAGHALHRDTLQRHVSLETPAVELFLQLPRKLFVHDLLQC
mmetsp:Transcript_16118/g.62863  ORF Transcript_16118/g.62863 Transcript_16118/m.62863 type:complete len:207 (+) Transcript_16118:1211-1831(+)